MLKSYNKNRLLVGIGKAQHLMLNLGRKFEAKQVIAGAGKVAAIVVELGQDFAQLCFPTAVRLRPYCQSEDLAVISPVKHCRHPEFPANRADAATAPCGDGIPVKRKVS
jgi:hypothetical protein